MKIDVLFNNELCRRMLFVVPIITERVTYLHCDEGRKSVLVCFTASMSTRKYGFAFCQQI